MAVYEIELADGSAYEVETSDQAVASGGAPSTRQQMVGQEMQEMESSPLGSFTSGARSVMTFGLSDLLSKQFGISPPESKYRTAGQAATIAGGIGPPILRGISHVAKGVPYTRLFGGGKRFAGELAKSPAKVNLAEEAETLARGRHGVNPALKKQSLSKAEQIYQNLTGKTPVEDLLNARGQVGVSEAHDVANLTSQNLAKSYLEKLGEALRGGNDLQQLGLKASINRKIVAASPALKELYKNYSTGQTMNQFASMLNPFGLPLKIIKAIKSAK